MKHPRLILWYALIAPLSLLFIAAQFVWLIPAVFAGLMNVFHNLMFRFELWAKYNDHSGLINDPHKTTLWSAFKESFEQGY